MNELSSVAQFIKDIGFPIAVAIFVLVRLNGKLANLTDEIVKLNERITHLVSTIERLIDEN